MEKEISSTTTSSKSTFNELNNQLQGLYIKYKEELEMQIRTLDDPAVLAAIEKELAEVNQRIMK